MKITGLEDILLVMMPCIRSKKYSDSMPEEYPYLKPGSSAEYGTEVSKAYLEN